MRRERRIYEKQKKKQTKSTKVKLKKKRIYEEEAKVKSIYRRQRGSGPYDEVATRSLQAPSERPSGDIPAPPLPPSSYFSLLGTRSAAMRFHLGQSLSLSCSLRFLPPRRAQPTRAREREKRGPAAIMAHSKWQSLYTYVHSNWMCVCVWIFATQL